MKKTIFNIIGKVFIALYIALILWFICSWMEVLSRSPGDGKQYNPYNAFVILEKSKNNSENFQN